MGHNSAPLKANRLTLTASIATRDPLRYSPAGIPILNVRLLHQSEQVEAGKPRSVTCEMPAVAIGDVAVALAKRLEATQPETEWQFSGFLATQRRFEIAELHITEFIEPPHASSDSSEARNR